MSDIDTLLIDNLWAIALGYAFFGAMAEWLDIRAFTLAVALMAVLLIVDLVSRALVAITARKDKSDHVQGEQ